MKTMAAIMAGAFTAVAAATAYYAVVVKPHDDALHAVVGCVNAHGGTEAAWEACAR